MRTAANKRVLSPDVALDVRFLRNAQHHLRIANGAFAAVEPSPSLSQLAAEVADAHNRIEAEIRLRLDADRRGG
jgi:hypothetical protein